MECEWNAKMRVLNWFFQNVISTGSNFLHILGTNWQQPTYDSQPQHSSYDWQESSSSYSPWKEASPVEADDDDEEDALIKVAQQLSLEDSEKQASSESSESEEQEEQEESEEDNEVSAELVDVIGDGNCLFR